MTLASATALLLISGFGAVLALQHCQIDCSQYTSGKNKADDPTDCHKFYYCYDLNDHSDISFNCPTGEDFDTNTKECMDPSSSSFACAPSCEKCTFDCVSAVLGKAANPFDCSVYYECDAIGGVLHTRECPSTAHYFDGTNCQTDKNQCCTCRPECSRNDVQAHRKLADYKNCTNFYLCITEGIATEDTHGHCPRGNFNNAVGECEEGAPCIAPCQEGPAIDHCDSGDDFVCTSVGYFPKCKTVCDPHYYYCTNADIGHPVDAKTCTRDNVIDPLQVLCVSPEECPCPCAAPKNVS